MTTAMSTKNQIFDFGRFTAALRKEWAENKRLMLLVMLGIYLVFAAGLIMGNYLNRGMGNNAVDPMFTFLFMGIISSLGFAGLASKGKRMNYLISPSSTVEKFTANALIYVIGGIVAVFLCIGLADLTRIAALWFFRSDDLLVSGPTAFADTVIKWVDPKGDFWSCLPEFLLNCLWWSSVFMLGSILWPKHSLLKTGLAIIAYFILVIILVLINHRGPSSFSKGWENYERIAPYIDCVIIVLGWVIGWILFKGKDVIARKWRIVTTNN